MKDVRFSGSTVIIILFYPYLHLAHPHHRSAGSVLRVAVCPPLGSHTPPRGYTLKSSQGPVLYLQDGL